MTYSPLKSSCATISRTCRNAGYTLLELVFSLALLVTLISIAAPSLTKFIVRNELNVDATRLHQSLRLARNAAINREHIVQVCQLADDLKSCGGNAANRSWSNGWLVFADLNQNNGLDSSDEILSTTVLAGSTHIVFNQRGRLRFFPSGGARSAGFYLCEPTGNTFKYIRLLHSGRARNSSTLSHHNREKCLSSLE